CGSTASPARRTATNPRGRLARRGPRPRPVPSRPVQRPPGTTNFRGPCGPRVSDHRRWPRGIAVRVLSNRSTPMLTAEEVRQEYRRLVDEAGSLAGALTDLKRRATVYYHVYLESGRNHIFPLIAAHGALWAKGHFDYGRQLGRWVSCQYLLNRSKRQGQLA